MFLKNILIIILLFTAAGYSYSNQNNNDIAASTKYFDFRSNYWLNLYHYLYQSARVSGGKSVESKLQKEFWEKLSENEKKDYQNYLEYFKTEIIDKDLRMDPLLFNLKRNIINFNREDKIAINSISDTLVAVLNNFRNLFDKYLWEEINLQNIETINSNLELIKKHEEIIVKDLENYTGSTWQKENVRVDVSYFSKENRGRNTAYTTVNPEVHIVISSLMNNPPGNWFELIFHEASHHLILGSEGFISKQIEEAGKETNIKPPGELWHAILFYISGRVVQNILAEENISYEIYMKRNKVFADFYPFLEKYIEGYLNNKTDFKTCAKNILIEYK